MKLVLERLPMDFSVAKLNGMQGLDLSGDFTFFAKTDEEISLACPTDALPANTKEVAHGWKAMRIAGQLDFGMIGVIASIAQILAQEKISIFVVSTYNTDYLLLRAEAMEAAEKVLEAAGYTLA